MMFELFPRHLFGDSCTTHAQWVSLIRSFASQGTIDCSHISSQLVRIDDLPGSIIIRDHTGLSARRQLHWRMNWVISIQPSMVAQQASCITDIDWHRHFILSGMRYCWYAMGMLQGNNASPAFSVDDSLYRPFIVALLQRFFDWIPQLQVHYSRYCVGIRDLMFFSGELRTVRPRISVWSFVLHLLVESGVYHNIDELAKLVEDTHSGDCHSALRELGLLR